jgi:cytochrome c oxidase subunit II
MFMGWLLAVLSAGCAGRHSVLDPASDQAHDISQLWWIFFYVTATLYLVVVVLMLIGSLRRREQATVTDAPVQPLHRPQERRITAVVSAGIGVTIVILLTLMVADFSTGRAAHALEDPNALVIQIIGHRWWWEVRYKDPIPGNMLVTANELHVPVGKPVKLELNSTDVIHSFWAPNFNGKKDAIPGHPSTNWIRATRPGEYRGQCAEYCGYQHAHMRFLVVAESQQQFDAWRQQASQPAPPPATDAQRIGQQLFLNGTCAMCHTIGGTKASATVGPNLTHVASRKLLGAASFENTPELLRRWIVDPQHFKPGVLMPQQTLRPDEVEALATYLGSLK